MAQRKSTYLITFLFLCFAAGWSSAAVSKEEAKKFPPISGEIYGQAVPGVKSITVNNRPVAIDQNQNFRSFINLKAGEKYLTLNVNYGSFRIVKKYLILRRPQVKTFKVYVPKEKIERPAEVTLPPEKISLEAKKRKIIMSKTRARERLRRALLEKIRLKKLAAHKLAVKRAKELKAPQYLYVWEFDRGKLLLVKKSKGKYSAEIYIPATQQWFDLGKLSRRELRNIPPGRTVKK